MSSFGMVTLSDKEVRIAKHIAKARNDVALKHNVPNTKIGSNTHLADNINGMGGEMAFCKLFNLYPDFTVLDTPGDLPDADCRLDNGLTIDVKTTEYHTGTLISALTNKDTEVDIFVLMTGKIPNYTYRGMARREDLINDASIAEWGKPGIKNYGMAQKDLVKEVR